MNPYLMIVAVGPVQEFVRAARRTRDLWYGSWLLSELVKAAASELEAVPGARLVFPDTGLLHGDSPVTNKLVVRLEDVSDAGWLRTVAARAEQAVKGRLRQEADRVLAKVRRVRPELVDERRFERQCEDFLEFYAVWVPEGGSYAAARQRAERLLAGRKMMRDFRANEGAPVVKSSLDGARETVFAGPLPKAIPELGLREQEALDAIGLMKRLGAEDRPYPSVVRVAVDPWVRALAHAPAREPREALAALNAYLDELCRQVPNLVTRTDPKAYRQYEDFPFDGKVLLEGFEEQQEFKDLRRERPELSNELRRRLQVVRGAAKKAGLAPYPHPYVALLLADGDHMGAALDELTSAEDHQRVSQRLSAFAQAAGRIVEQHQGALVYAGGDDVFAFVPVDQCLQVAQSLRDEFARVVGGAFGGGVKPTLSVGLFVGYCRDPLGDLRRGAEEAERGAKEPDRNALCVRIAPRSGGDPLVYRRRWELDPVIRLRRWVDAVRTAAVPTGLGYELDALRRRFGAASGVRLDWVAAELAYVLRRKRAGAGRDETLSVAVRQALAEELRLADDPVQGLAGVAHLLKMAKWLAGATGPGSGCTGAGDGGDQGVHRVAGD
ncbi:MAG: type III-B CRISPR-associated protein Cas10/Cmr2 [Alicyclobacillaceae bacterium]|nr:type III-B CRISPR-associated protein Cas10/Cmr2 [Alicyclobacillaceae bacterium]